MTVDPDCLSDRTEHPEGVESSEAPEGAKGTGEGAKHIDTNRFTETSYDDSGNIEEVRSVEGDPKEKLRRIQAAKEGVEE